MTAPASPKKREPLKRWFITYLWVAPLIALIVYTRQLAAIEVPSAASPGNLTSAAGLLFGAIFAAVVTAAVRLWWEEKENRTVLQTAVAVVLVGATEGAAVWGHVIGDQFYGWIGSSLMVGLPVGLVAGVIDDLMHPCPEHA